MSFDDVVDSIGDGFENIASGAVEYLPKILGALVVLVIGLFVSRFLARFIGNVVNWIENFNWYRSLMSRAKFSYTFARPVEAISYWVFLLIFISTAVHILGLEVLSDTFNAIIGYIPSVVSAALIVGVAIWGGSVLREIVVTTIDQSKVDSRYKNFLGALVYVAVLVFGVTIGLSQLGFNTLILTTNVTVIVAGFALAAAIAFGLGSKAVAGSLVAGMYAKNHIKKGQKLAVGDVHGTVKDVSATTVTLETKDGDVIMPYTKVLS